MRFFVFLGTLKVSRSAPTAPCALSASSCTLVVPQFVSELLVHPSGGRIKESNRLCANRLWVEQAPISPVIGQTWSDQSGADVEFSLPREGEHRGPPDGKTKRVI